MRRLRLLRLQLLTDPAQVKPSSSLRARVDSIERAWDALDARLLAAMDRRPVLWWVLAAACAGGLFALPGTLLGWLVNGVLTVDAGNEGVLLIGAVPILFFLGLAVAAPGVLLSALVGRWFGLGRSRSRLVTAALVICSLLPWVIPGGPLLSRAGQARGWALLFAVAGCLVLPAAALLVPRSRRLRAIGALCLLVTGSLWLTARQERLATETAVALKGLGSPPRDLVRVLSWDGASPATLTNSSHTMVGIEYDEDTPIPAPDGSEVAVLTIGPLPTGWDAAPEQAACAAGRSAALRLPADPAENADPSTACHKVGPQEWQVGSRTVVLRSGSVLLTLVSVGLASGDASPEVLRSVVRTQHVADDAELRQLSPG